MVNSHSRSPRNSDLDDKTTQRFLSLVSKSDRLDSPRLTDILRKEERLFVVDAQAVLVRRKVVLVCGYISDDKLRQDLVEYISTELDGTPFSSEQTWLRIPTEGIPIAYNEHKNGVPSSPIGLIVQFLRHDDSHGRPYGVTEAVKRKIYYHLSTHYDIHRGPRGIRRPLVGLLDRVDSLAYKMREGEEPIIAYRNIVKAAREIL